MPLTLTEEILMLMLDDATGRLVDGAAPAGELAIVAAALMELALAGRIDTDTEHLFVTSVEPTGDAVLDEVLFRIAAAPEELPSGGWMLRLGGLAPQLREWLFERLALHGILRAEGLVFTWETGGRSLGKLAGEAEREVKARLTELLLGDAIPDPRDALLLGLAEATGLLPHVLPPDLLAPAGPRIAAVARLEELNRSLARVVRAMARRLPG